MVSTRADRRSPYVRAVVYNGDVHHGILSLGLDRRRSRLWRWRWRRRCSRDLDLLFRNRRSSRRLSRSKTRWDLPQGYVQTPDKRISAKVTDNGRGVLEAALSREPPRRAPQLFARILCSRCDRRRRLDPICRRASNASTTSSVVCTMQLYAAYAGFLIAFERE